MSSERVRVRVPRRVARVRLKAAPALAGVATSGSSSGLAPSASSSAGFAPAASLVAATAALTPVASSSSGQGSGPPAIPAALAAHAAAAQAAASPRAATAAGVHAPLASPPVGPPVTRRPSGPSRSMPQLGALDLERARREGLAEGERIGREAARRELGALGVRLADALADAKRRTDDELLEVETRVAEVALAIAERIVGCEVKAGRYDLVAVLERALGRARGAGGAEVRLNPADVAAVSGAAAGRSEAVQSCRFVGDAAVPRGELVLETEAGRIVHSIPAELDAVRRAIQDGETEG